MSKKLSDANLNFLYHFYKIAESKSLRKAAAELNISPPALTHSLKKMEEFFACKLCNRANNHFSLTSDGHQLYQILAQNFLSLEKFSKNENKNENINENYTGLISIGIIDHFENHVFSLAIKTLSQKFPNLKISLQVLNAKKMTKSVLSHDLDIGFGFFREQNLRLSYLDVGSEKIDYYISNNHKLWTKKVLSQKDLKSIEVTQVDPEERNRAELEADIFNLIFFKTLKPIAFANDLSAAFQLLIAGHAAVPLPDWFAEKYILKNEIRKLENFRETKIIKLHCMFDPLRDLSSPLRFLTQFIENEIKKN